VRAEEGRREGLDTQHVLKRHAQYNTVEMSITQHYSAQHSTAQHSTAQHSTAQNSQSPSFGGGGGPARIGPSTRHGHLKTVCGDISLQFECGLILIRIRVCVVQKACLFRMVPVL
jgi:hypothetical protein